MRQLSKLIAISFLFIGCTTNPKMNNAGITLLVDTISKVDTIAKTLPITNAANIDTLVVNQRAAVFIDPDSLKINKWKVKAGEENFYTAADDYMFYLSTAYRYLDSVRLPTINAKEKKFIKFVGENKTEQLVEIAKIPELWSIYFFDPNLKAKQIDMIMIDEAYKRYFNSAL